MRQGRGCCVILIDGNNFQEKRRTTSVFISNLSREINRHPGLKEGLVFKEGTVVSFLY